ncbi:hypothetical protein DITRI_Ditri16bG0055500 [Diplodiscus trichospermus]
MVFEGAFPDGYTFSSIFSSIFKAISDLGLELEGRRAHGLSVVFGWDSSSTFVGSSLIDMQGEDAEALKAFKTVIKKGIKANNVLLRCSSCAMLEEGKRIYALVSNFGLDRDRYPGATLTDSYETAEVLRTASNSAELSTDHYACMIDLLGCSRRLEEAETLIKQDIDEKEGKASVLSQ